MSTTSVSGVLVGERTDIDVGRWLRVLARWSLVAVLAVLCLMALYFGGIGYSSADNALGADYSELLQAARTPALYRLTMVFDASGWLLMGGALLLLGYILHARAPIRALLISACGIGALTGTLGGMLRLGGISALGVQYAAATPDQQATLLPTMLALREVVNTCFVAGDVLVGAGYLLVASIVLARVGFPRLLAVWFVLAGAFDFAVAYMNAVGPFSFVLLLVAVIFGVGGLHLGMAIAFWRPKPALLAAVAA